METNLYLWMIPLLPLLGAAWNGLAGRSAPEGRVATVALGSVGLSFVMAVRAFLLLGPVWNIVNSFSELQRSLAAMERVFEVLAMEDDKPDRPDAREAPRTVNEIRFEGENLVDVRRDERGHAWFPPGLGRPDRVAGHADNPMAFPEQIKRFSGLLGETDDARRVNGTGSHFSRTPVT